MSNVEGEHYLAYAFPLIPSIEGKHGGGGLATTIAREATFFKESSSSSRLNVLSSDEESRRLHDYSLDILAAEQSSDQSGDIFGVWFVDQWVVFHTDAYSNLSGYPNEVLGAMFQGEKYTQPVGSLGRAKEYVEKFGFSAQNPRVLGEFSNRFDQQIWNISPNSIINWQDYMFYPLMQRHSEVLRGKGCWQSYHHHVTISEQLSQFSQGVDFLKAVSLMDEVCVHTDIYAQRLEKHLQALGLHIPTIRRYDLGVDSVNIERRLRNITKDTYQESIEYKGLSQDQKVVIDEIVSTQGTNLHRFVVIDRADEGKGPTVVLDGMDRLLSTLTKEEQTQFRFYFIVPQLDWGEVTFSPKHNYTSFLRKKLEDMKEKYPDVLHYMPGIPPGLISLLQCDAHSITGGIQDGLCLSPMEGLKVNGLTGNDRSAIIGMGTGFAMQTMQVERHSNLVNFVKQGSVDDMARAIGSIARAEKNDPGRLGRQTRQLVEEVIDKRIDGVLVYPR